MQDPKTKQVDSWDEEVVDVKPTQVSDWGEDVVDTPIQKKSEVGNESSQPLQQDTEGSAMPTTESATDEIKAAKHPDFSEDDYDYKSAKENNLIADETGHYPSRVPSGEREGLLLKSERHPTFYKTVQGEKDAGYSIYKNIDDGRLYSFKDIPKEKEGKFEKYDAVQLEDVEIVAEKPNFLEKIKGAFMQGVEQSKKDAEDYEILASNRPPQYKIELLEKRKAEQLPQRDFNIFETTANIFGGTAVGMGRSITAGMAASFGSPIASVIAATGVAMGDGYRQGFSGAYKEAYYQAIDEGKTPEQAVEIAQQVGQAGAIGGATEGAFGAIPLTKGITKFIKPGSKLLKKGVEIALDATIDGSVAAGAQVGTNFEAQRQGLKRELKQGAGEAFAGEAMFGTGMNLASPTFKVIARNTIGKLYTTGVDKADKKDAVTIAATQPIEVSQAAAQEAVKQGAITEQEAADITQEVVNRKKAINAMPSNLTLDEQNDMAETIEQRQKLEAELDKVSDALKPIVQGQIDELDKTIPIPIPQNEKDLKDGQLYIAKDGSVKTWDATKENFVYVEGKKKTADVSGVMNKIYELNQARKYASDERKIEIDKEIEALRASIENKTEEVTTQTEDAKPKEAKVEVGTEVELEPKVTETKVAVTEPKQEPTTQPTNEVSPSSIDNGEAAVVETPKVEESSVGAGEDAGTSLRGVKYSDIIVDDKYLEDILSDNKLSEEEKKQVREVFARGVDYFKFDKEGEQRFQEKFANPEDITDIADIIEGVSLAKEAEFNFYNTKNYENVKDAVNYIANNPNEYSPRVVNAVKEIKEKLDNPSSSMGRLYAIDVMKELGISKQSIAETPKSETQTETVATEPAPVPETTEQDFRTLREEEQAANQDEEIRELLIEEEAKIRRASERLMEAERLKGMPIEDESDYKEAVIADNMGRVSEQSFKDFSDENFVNDEIRGAYFPNSKTKRVMTLDQLADEISGHVGMPISVQDIVDFIIKYPEGVGNRRDRKENTFYAGNNPVTKRAELLADAEGILGYKLDEEGLERFAKESADLADKIAKLEAKPISDADVDALNLEYEEYLKSLTDGQRKRELAKQRIEGEQIVEGAEDANLKAIKDRDAEARESEEGIVPIVEQVAETIEDRIAKAKAALKERNAGKLRSGLDFENLDLYTELAYLYIRKGVKSAADFAKELGEELSDAIKKAWDAANENVKSETENFDKWKAYAKKQFEAEDGGLEFQDFKARFNKKFNVAADDVALVEVFSEAQSEYNAERGKSVLRKEVDKSFKSERKKVEVDEKAALKDQIRLEAKAAKEGFREARKQQQSFADRIKAFLDSAEVKGKLTPAQTKSLINRASNIKTERGLDNFIEYAEKVIDNVNYDAEMNAVRKQQQTAKSRKHTSMQKAVNEFLAINPETIPNNLMPEYQKALDELGGRVPSYKTFQDIYHQVMSLNTPKDNFSNVKTYNDALDLYNSIAVNKVTSIEEYRQLFKDINAFKRKVDALFENGDITEQEHTDLLEQVGKDQKTVEDKYASEIYSLKTDLILEMKNMFNSVSLQNMTEEGKDLLRRLNKLNNNDLRNLSPEEIYNLTSILDNIRETGYVDIFRLNGIIGKANAVFEGKEIGGQIQKAKPFSSIKASVKEVSDKLSETYSSFWEDKLGLGSREAGAYYNNIVSPMERAVSSYREAVQNGYKKINELKKKHSIKQESMDRIGLFASYLREYGLGQDVDTKGKKDSKGDLFGTRDWFKTILEQQKETQTLSKDDIDAMRKAWESLPKTNGKVDVEALEKSYRDGTNQFLSKNEMEFLKEMMAWKDENLTGKQQAANEFRGKGFNPLLYHIKRIRKDGKQKDVTSPIEITEQGNVRIAAGSGKEVQTNEVGAIEHNFEKIFSNNLEETMRDYYMTPMLQQASQVLSNAEKTAGKKNGYVEVMRKNLADAVNNEFASEETNKISRFFSQSLLKARAAQVLIAPLRTVGELVSSLVSYPMRTREMGSYLEIFRKKDVAQKLLNATGSPFKDKANINKHFDVQDGSLKEQGKFDLATGYFAAMPERAGLLPVWMASFDSAFKKNAGVDFDRDAYMNNPAYEKKYQRDIDNAASQADALYGEIAGSPTKAGQRREVRFAPSVSAFGKSFGLGNTVSANSPVGKVVAFMTGYPFREVEGMLKAGSAMKESVKDADASKANVAAQALPIVGSILGAATYGLFQSLNYELGNLLMGDDEEKKQAKDNIETLTSPMGLLKETLAGTTSLLASKYSGAGRQMIKWMGSLAYNMTDDEKNKVAIRSMIRNVTFQDPYEIKFTKNGKVNKFMQKEKIAKEITDGIAPLTVFVDNTTKAVESIGGYQYLRDKINKGELLTEPEKEAVVLTYITFNALNMVGMAWGTGIPVTTLNKLAKKAIKEKEDASKSNSRGDTRGTNFLPSGGGSAKDLLPSNK